MSSTRQMLKWMVVSILVTTAVGMILTAGVLADSTNQRGYDVWEAGCIASVETTVHARAVVPLNNHGDPDTKKGWITGLVVKLRPNCDHIEVHPDGWDGKTK